MEENDILMNELENLAIKYFDGLSTAGEEERLFAFIVSKKENEGIFKKWEKSWFKEFSESNEGEQEWLKFAEKIRLSHNNEVEVATIKRSFLSTWPSKIAICILALIIGGGFYLIRNLTRNMFDDNRYIIQAPIGERSTITLPDQTVVKLNAGTSLSYTGSFNVKNRQVELVGEAYFEVNKRSKLPFIVKTPKYDIAVRGTKFNVSSYEGDDFYTTSLIAGSLELLYKGLSYKMKSGEIIKLDIEKDLLIKSTGRVQQYTSWIEQKIEYDAITLDDLVKRLSRQKGVNIRLEIKEEKTLRISLNNNESIEAILEGITKVIPLKVYYKNNVIHIKE